MVHMWMHSSTLTEPFQWEQGRWASTLAVLGTGQAPGWGWFRQGSYLRILLSIYLSVLWG